MALRLGFAGTPAFAAAHLHALNRAGRKPLLVITQPDRPGRRGRRPLPSPVKQAARDAGLPLLQPEHIRHCQKEIAALRLDLLIVVAYGQLLPAGILQTPTHGCINLHTSLLPRWRGAAPVQRALEAGDKMTGVTVMQLDEGMDTGPILLQRELPVLGNDTSESLLERMSEAGPPLLLEAMRALETGQLRPRAQAETGVTHAPRLEKQEANLDWSRPAALLERKVRACIPNPVAATWLPQEEAPLRLRIWQTECLEVDAGGEQPGTLLAADAQGLVVACGKGCLRIRKLQLPLGKGTVLSVADVRNARPQLFRPGLRLVSNAQ